MDLMIHDRNVGECGIQAARKLMPAEQVQSGYLVRLPADFEKLGKAGL